MTEAFARQGSVVCFVDIAVAEGEALAARLAVEGLKARFAACDITKTADYQQVIHRFGGGGRPGPRARQQCRQRPASFAWTICPRNSSTAPSPSTCVTRCLRRRPWCR
ncbi:hypothetical protein [Micropruina sp.]|uniref:hypothetical protein n=1 Tax=Micropruina sp. TaxID=2737536 RepID=UPI0039E51D0D